MTAIRVTLLTLLLTGVAYPLAVTGVAQLAFPREANGTLVRGEGGEVVGSEWVGQRFGEAAYLQPRPSAAGAGYDASASSGSNLGPTSRALAERVASERARLSAENPLAVGPVPAELVTASGSGLDPHLSPAAAQWQAPRIAAARGVEEGRVRALLDAQVEGRSFGFLGEPRLNVLGVNLALDRQFGRPPGAKRVEWRSPPP